MREGFRRLMHERRLLIALLALFYTALFMPSVLSVQPPALPVAERSFMLLGAFMYAWAFFFALRSIRPLFIVLTPLLFAASAATSHYMGLYRFEMTYQQLAVVTEAQGELAAAFISLKLILWVVACLAIGIALTRVCLKREVADAKDARVTFICGVLLVAVFVSEVGAITQRYFPYNLLFAVRDLAAEKIALARGDDIPVEQATRTAGSEPITIILIVGESVRAQNWGLNGYARQTTPLLAARKGIINYTDVASCFPLTRIAVPCILTDARHDAVASIQQTAQYRHSLIRQFRGLGFFTASIDMHGMSNSVFGSPVSSLLGEGHQLVSFTSQASDENNVDDAGVESLGRILSEHRTRDLFVFFHPFGSHWPFDTRYPDAFRRFTPVCNPRDASLVNLARDMSECVPEELVNAYDNSILYADHIVNAVMEQVADRAALVVFTSDHGQSLGEDGLYLHGHIDAAMERRVPLTIWASPAFEKRYARELKAMRAKQSTPTSHDTIFHSLLHCIGAEGSMIDPKQSLCH